MYYSAICGYRSSEAGEGLHGNDQKEGITYYLFINHGLSNLFVDMSKIQCGCYQIWTPQGSGD